MVDQAKEKNGPWAVAIDPVTNPDGRDAGRKNAGPPSEGDGWDWFCRRSRLGQAALIAAVLATTYLVFILICAAAIFTGRGYS